MAFLEYVVMILMFLVALFLIVLVLVQRGRGGGLAGALGGMGGQSAFGTKAGDVFTKITIIVAAFWILMCVGAVKLYSTTENQFQATGANAPPQEPPGDAVQPVPNYDGTGPSDSPPSGAGAAGGAQPSGGEPGTDPES